LYLRWSSSGSLPALAALLAALSIADNDATVGLIAFCLAFALSTSSLLAIEKSPPNPANANARPTADVSPFSNADVLFTNPVLSRSAA
jgi:monomeric isocitrate dehydrogenase